MDSLKGVQIFSTAQYLYSFSRYSSNRMEIIILWKNLARNADLRKYSIRIELCTVPN